ncbi:MAG: type II secretion system protein GspL, partial [Nitrospiria bacterium]
KGVRIAQGFRGLRLIDAFERKVSREERGNLFRADPLTEGQLDTLKELISEGLIRPGEMVAVSLPGHLISIREMTLPFADPKKLRQIVPYEMESQLPFDLEQIAIDYQILDSGDEAAPVSHILVSTVPKTVLRKFLHALQAVGIDPVWVCIDSLSLHTFSQYFLGTRPEKMRNLRDAQDSGERLVIDVGASKTVLCDTQGGRLRWVRTIPMGGDLITEALQKAFELSVEEAEGFKRRIDLEKADQNPETQRGAACIEEALLPWLTEIEKSLRNLSGGDEQPSGERPTGEKRGSFFLCGGGESLKGLREVLSKTLDMKPALPDSGPESKGFSMAGLELLNTASVSHLFPQGLGLALPPMEGSNINFRRGEFVFGKETIERRNRLVSIGVVALLLLGLVAGDLTLRYHQKEQRYRDLKGELRQTFVETFPQMRNVMNEVEQARVAIETLNRTGDFLGLGEGSPLAVLNEITERIPKEVRIDVRELVIDGGNVRILAQTDSFDSVDRIRGGFLKGNRFREVSVSDAKVMADQSRVRFRIKMKVIERGGREEKRPS